ncbi:MAG: redoxin domain-containing protein [Anaerolineae bacterium]|nr:redoxin domain-containing protein [Anaerolineae bacterium]
MSTDVTIGLAFVAGLISFISPCVLPLVPAYVGYMGGRMTRQASQQAPHTSEGFRGGFRQRFGTLTHGLFFVLGFTLFFVLFGLLTTAAVSSLTALGVTEADVRDGIARVGGVAVILFGLHILGVMNRIFTWLQKQAPRLDQNPYGNVISAGITLALIGVTYWLFVESWFLTLVAVLLFVQLFGNAFKADSAGEFWARVIQHVQVALYVDTRRQTGPQQDRYGYLGSLFMGVVFSAGWTPCIGPIYGAVLTLASSGGSISEAGTLLTAYSLGLGIPFLLTALALDQAQGVLRRLQKRMRSIEVFSGAFLILVGVLVFTGQLERLSQIGGNEGTFGDVSLNLENCVVGATEGRVRWRNVPACIKDGLKEDFYISYDKGLNTAVAPAENSVSAPDLAAGDASAPLDVPALDGGLSGSGAAVEALPLDAAGESAGAADIPEGLDVGQRAPDFTARTLDGQTVSLSDFRGQTVLVNFWATWCGPCRDEMPDFQTLVDTRGSDGFIVLAVDNQESASQVAAFVEEFGLTFPVVLDEDGRINDGIYGRRIQGYPTSFLIDPDGVIVDYFPGIVDASRLLAALETVLDR